MTLDGARAWVGDVNGLALEPQPRVTVGLHDVTLSAADGGAGAAHSPEHALVLAGALDAAGVDRIEVGCPAASADRRRVAELVAGAGLRAQAWGVVRGAGDVPALADAGLGAAVVEIPVSDRALAALGLAREEALGRVARAARAAADGGLRVVFRAVDASRADLDFLDDAYEAAAGAGAAEVAVGDTAGVATPEAAALLVSRALDVLGPGVSVHWHGHDGFGLATASAVAAVQAGATWVHGTARGTPAQGGATGLVEVALALEALYGIPTRLDLTQAGEAARAAAEQRLRGAGVPAPSGGSPGGA